jgi:beta-glucanase (GH16 family)
MIMPKKYLGFLVLTMLVAFACKKSGGGSDPIPAPTPPVTPVTPVVDPPVTPTPIVPPTIYSGYSLLWNDEFNDAGIDLNKWKMETGTGVNGDFGTGQLDRATDRPENATIANGVLNSGGGCLAITTRRERYMDRNYTSARLTTEGKGDWGPGTRIEARVWAKDVLYKGQGFAFWMMPAEKPGNQPYIMWPQGGEVDVMEYVGSIPSYNLATVHYAWFWENNTYVDWNHGHQGAYYSYGEKQVPATNPSQGGWPVQAGSESAGSGGFHIYRADWYSDRLEFSIDDQVYHIHYFKDGGAFNGVADGQDANGNVTINGKRVFKSEYSSQHFAEWSPFEHNFFLLLTAGVGGSDQVTYGGAIVPEAVFPCTTYIDWIRVYKRL